MQSASSGKKPTGKKVAGDEFVPHTDREHEETEREKREISVDLQPDHEPLLGPKTPQKPDKALKGENQHEFMISGFVQPSQSKASPQKSEKQQMLDMGYPEHLIQQTPEGKAVFDFGAAEDEALFSALTQEGSGTDDSDDE